MRYITRANGKPLELVGLEGNPGMWQNLFFCDPHKSAVYADLLEAGKLPSEYGTMFGGTVDRIEFRNGRTAQRPGTKLDPKKGKHDPKHRPFQTHQLKRAKKEVHYDSSAHSADR